MEGFVEHIKQHPGPVQVTRKVVVDVPGKHFPGLQPAEQKAVYSGTAVEYRPSSCRRRQAPALSSSSA